MKVGSEGDEGQDIFGGIGSFFLVLLLLTEFALWIKVAETQNLLTRRKTQVSLVWGATSQKGFLALTLSLLPSLLLPFLLLLPRPSWKR